MYKSKELALHRHPNDIVVHHLVTFFDGAFNPSQMIVHSTWWRYAQHCDRLLLTYVALLPQGRWVQQWIAAARIYAEPIGAIEKEMCRSASGAFKYSLLDGKEGVWGDDISSPHVCICMNSPATPAYSR